MIFLLIGGIILVGGGVTGIVIGSSMNNNLLLQAKTLINTGSTNPGSIYITLGIVGLIIGIVLIGIFVFMKLRNKKEEE